MSKINNYLKEIQKRYPNTSEVRDQIEELRDTLHSKTEELQAQGMSYEDAAQEAIISMGDVSELFGMVSGEARMVYRNRLNRNNAWALTGIIMAEFLLSYALALLLPILMVLSREIPGQDLTIAISAQLNMDTLHVFLAAFIPCMIGVLVWPAIATIQYCKNPDEAEIVQFEYKKLLKISLMGWGIISLAMFFINWITGLDAIWFVWPVIGVSNWPVNLWLYHRQLQSGKYDAKEQC